MVLGEIPPQKKQQHPNKIASVPLDMYKKSF